MRFDTSAFAGITAVLLTDGRIRVVNDSPRAFAVTAGLDRVVVISPGATKEFDLEGETFSMGWHVSLDPAHAWPFPDRHVDAALELHPTEEELASKPGPDLDEVVRPDTFIEFPPPNGE